MKPTLYSTDVENTFKDRDEPVSISIDTLQCSPYSGKKILVQLEPPGVKNLIDDIIQFHNHYDLILAWHPKILEKCSNAKKFIYGTTWIDLKTFKAEKKNQVSFITSSKDFTDGHHLRQLIYSMLQGYKIDGFEVLTYRSPPQVPSKAPFFENAKFSIVVENEMYPNWITEKLIDCFVTKTVPLYWGASNVGDFFNEDGVFKFTTLNELKLLLNMMIEDGIYETLLFAIEDNYNRALEFLDFHKRVDAEIDLL